MPAMGCGTHLETLNAIHEGTVFGCCSVVTIVCFNVCRDPFLRFLPPVVYVILSSLQEIGYLIIVIKNGVQGYKIVY